LLAHLDLHLGYPNVDLWVLLAPLARVVKSFPLNIIRKINSLVIDQIIGTLISISSHSMPYKMPLKKS